MARKKINRTVEDAIMTAVEYATESMFDAARCHEDLQRVLRERAAGIYFGAWRIALRLGGGTESLPDPMEWTRWAWEAACEAARRETEAKERAA